VPALVNRRAFLRWAFVLEVVTVGWNLVEGIIATVAGALAGSVALVGFGVDSFIETASGLVVGRRFWLELHGQSREQSEQAERKASKIAGALLLALAAYITFDAGRRFLGYGPEARESFVGIGLTIISLILMPLLGWSKLRTARLLGSRALRTDAYETVACAWLSLTTLTGLVLNAAFGWSWADPLAACVLVPLIVREGLEGLGGEDEEDEEKPE
jgi:divalent metal cation (Fe/Co/Zn/Cd) transporter